MSGHFGVNCVSEVSKLSGSHMVRSVLSNYKNRTCCLRNHLKPWCTTILQWKVTNCGLWGRLATVELAAQQTAVFVTDSMRRCTIKCTIAGTVTTNSGMHSYVIFVYFGKNVVPIGHGNSFHLVLESHGKWFSINSGHPVDFNVFCCFMYYSCKLNSLYRMRVGRQNPPWCTAWEVSKLHVLY